MRTGTVGWTCRSPIACCRRRCGGTWGARRRASRRCRGSAAGRFPTPSPGANLDQDGDLDMAAASYDTEIPVPSTEPPPQRDDYLGPSDPVQDAVDDPVARWLSAIPAASGTPGGGVFVYLQERPGEFRIVRLAREIAGAGARPAGPGWGWPPRHPRRQRLRPAGRRVPGRRRPVEAGGAPDRDDAQHHEPGRRATSTTTAWTSCSPPT